ATVENDVGPGRIGQLVKNVGDRFFLTVDRHRSALDLVFQDIRVDEWLIIFTIRQRCTECPREWDHVRRDDGDLRTLYLMRDRPGAKNHRPLYRPFRRPNLGE